MELRRLEVFCRVVELKSFSRAAEEVRLSQPTVSEQIRLLENASGEKLLDRLGREVLPTPAGEILYRYARQILQLREEAKQALAEFRGTLAGRLVLGASTIPGAYFLPPLIEKFHGRYPQSRVILRICGSAQIAREVLAGTLELGLVGALPQESGLEAQELFADRLRLALWPGHPWVGRRDLPLTELAGQPFILRENGSGTRQAMEEALLAGGFDPGRLTVVAEMGSNEAVREGIKGRLGISFLSSLALQEDLSRGTLATVPLLDTSIHRPFYLVRRRHRQPTPLGSAFLDQLRHPASI
ncbi:MAG: LysR family transcriptional regulator [Desulfuromonadales bacterium]|nr:LysR family transcriptional regulator [Desulfuromonadales bacterium]